MKDDKRRLREKAVSFRLVDGELFHIENDKQLKHVVIGEDDRIVRTLHGIIPGQIDQLLKVSGLP